MAKIHFGLVGFIISTRPWEYMHCTVYTLSESERNIPKPLWSELLMILTIYIERNILYQMNWLAHCTKDSAQGIKFGSSELESRAAWSLSHLASYTMLCNVFLKLISQMALGNNLIELWKATTSLQPQLSLLLKMLKDLSDYPQKCLPQNCLPVGNSS